MILEETGAFIVLSSAWRYLCLRGEMNLDGLNWLLRSHGIMDNRLIGITGPDTMVPYNTKFSGKPGTWPMENERGLQITKWINMQIEKLERYVVIDDLNLGIVEENHPFVQTNSKVGLTLELAQQAISILNG